MRYGAKWLSQPWELSCLQRAFRVLDGPNSERARPSRSVWKAIKPQHYERKLEEVEPKFEAFQR